MVGVVLVHASVDDKFHVGAAGAICEGFVEFFGDVSCNSAGLIFFLQTFILGPY